MTHQLGGLSHDLHLPNQNQAASDPQNIWRFWSVGSSAPPSCEGSVTFTGACWWWCEGVGVQVVRDATEWWWGSG